MPGDLLGGAFQACPLQQLLTCRSPHRFFTPQRLSKPVSLRALLL